MTLPFWVTEMGSYRGPQGADGEQGRPGTFDSATATTVAYGQPARAIIVGPNGENVEFEIPQGPPGVNAVPAQTAVASYIADPVSESNAAVGVVAAATIPGEVSDAASATRAQLDALYSVYLLWNGSAYPARVAGALNIFYGTTDPGLLMEDNDRWDAGNATSIQAVTDAMSDTGSALYAATMFAASTNAVPIQLTPLAGSTLERVALGVSPNRVLAWKLPDNVSSTLYASVPVPVLWTQVRVRIRWTQPGVGVTGNIRWTCDITPYETGVEASAGVHLESSQSVPAANVIKEAVFAGPVVSLGGGVAIALGRLGGSGADTALTDLQIIDVKLERVA